MSLELKVVTSPETFFKMREEWSGLVQRCRRASIFLTWEWLWTWWETYADAGMGLYLIEARAGARLVGLLPLYRQRERRLGVIVRSTLRFIGSGEPEREEVASEYPEVLVDDTHAAEVISAMATHLATNWNWDRTCLRNVLEDSNLFSVLPLSGWRRRARGQRYFIDLPKTFEEYLYSLGRSRAKRYRYLLRQLERAGRIEWFESSGKDVDAQALQQLACLHALRWRVKGKEGAFQGRFPDFHQRFAGRAIGDPLARILTLSLDGEPVAAYYGFRLAGTEYYYQSGFDCRRYKQYSLGTCLILRAIGTAIGEGLNRFDFMAGRERSYKARYCNRTTSMYDLELDRDAAVAGLTRWLSWTEAAAGS